MDYQFFSSEITKVHQSEMRHEAARRRLAACLPKHHPLRLWVGKFLVSTGESLVRTSREPATGISGAAAGISR